MTLDPNDDILAEQLFEAARRERPAPAAKRRAFRALSAPQPWLPKHRWLVAALALAATGALVVPAEQLGLLQGDGAGAGPALDAIKAEPVEVSSRSREAPAMPREVVSRRNPETEAPVAPVATAVPAVPARSAPRAAPSSGVGLRSAPQLAPASLERELQLLDAARQALLGGDTGAALERLAQYERAATRRHLGAEATVLRIQILAASGRTAEASALASQFAAKHPNSPLVDRAKSFIRESQWGDINQGVGP